MKTHLFPIRAILLLFALVYGLQSHGQAEGDVFAQYSETYLAEVRKLDEKYAEQKKDILEKEQDDGEDFWTPKRAIMLYRLAEDEYKTRNELRTRHLAYLEGVKNDLAAQFKNEEALVLQNEIERLKDGAIIDKMRSILIPEVNFRDAKIENVVSFLIDASREFDNPILPLELRGIIFSLIPPDAPANPENGAANEIQRINFATRYNDLYTILNTVVELAGMKYVIHNGIVSIVPLNWVNTK